MGGTSRTLASAAKLEAPAAGAQAAAVSGAHRPPCAGRRPREWEGRGRGADPAGRELRGSSSRRTAAARASMLRRRLGRNRRRERGRRDLGGKK